MEIKRKNKNKEYSFDPNSFLSGTHDFNPFGAISSWWNDEDEDDQAEKKYTQAGGDAGGLEGIYKEQAPSGPFESGRGKMGGPELPSESGEAVGMPEFAKSQMESYKDPEISERQEEEKRNLVRMALAQQTPLLAPPEAGMLASLLGQDKDSGLAHAGGAVAGVSEGEFADMSNRLDLAGITDRIGTRSAAKQVTGSPHDGTAPQSLLSAASGMEDFDDDMGNALNPEEDEGIMSKLGSLMSSDSSKTKPLSKSKQAGIKIATDLLTGSNRNTPIQNAPSAGVKMGRASFPGLLAASKRPVNPRYTPKGLG